MKAIGVTLPDGSQGFETNLLQNSDAEGLDDECNINSWHVNSMIAEKYNQVLLVTQSKSTQATMRQRVQVPDKYNLGAIYRCIFISFLRFK